MSVELKDILDIKSDIYNIQNEILDIKLEIDKIQGDLILIKEILKIEEN